ncbi:hypothetical protein U1Q18_002460, partial [Sarracenia purpurea var. burkii]
MNLSKIHHCHLRPPPFFVSQITPFSSPVYPLHFLSQPVSSIPHGHLSATPSPFPPNFLHRPQLTFRHSRVSKVERQVWSNGEEENSDDSTELEEDLAPEGDVYQKTLRLVECSMFAAVAGLAYFLSNSLAIENYFGCFFALPIVISSMRWGIAAGRKTMVCHSPY